MESVWRAAGNTPESRNVWNKINRGQTITSCHLNKKSSCMVSGSTDLILRR